jgi:hypothetical protein
VQLARRRAAFLFSSVAACLLVGVTTPGPVQGQPLRTGFVDDASFLNPDAATSAFWLAKSRLAGATLVRINVYWVNVAPRKPGPGFTPGDPADPAYDWNRVDDVVRNAAGNDLTPILTVLAAPTWAEGPDREASAPPGTWRPDPGALGTFARALARRYDGTFPDPENPGATLPRVAYFQAWNEPNLYYSLTPQFKGNRAISPEIYRTLLASFVQAVKSIQPSATVLTAGLAPIARPNATVGPLRFMRQLTCMSGGARPHPTCSRAVDADIWTTHPYTTGGPTHAAAGRDDVSLGDLSTMSAILRAADRYGHIRSKYQNVPFWVTEFSWDTSPPDPGGVPMRIAKRWVAEALYRMWSAGVSAVTWLTIRDAAAPDSPSAWGDTYQSGFYYFNGRPTSERAKPTLKAFRFPMVAFPEGRGIRVWGRTPTSRQGPVMLEIRHGGGWKASGSMRANRSGIFHGVIRSDLGRGSVRARFGSDISLPFSLTPVRDRYVRPFGG